MVRRYEVAILVDTANAYSQGIMRGIANYIWENGPWDVYYEERALDSRIPSWLDTWHGDGIIIRSKTREAAKKALKTGAKVVDLGESRTENLPTIYPDYAASARLAAEHLKAHQFKNFAYVGISGRNFSKQRWQAFHTYVDSPCYAYHLKQNNVNYAWNHPMGPFCKWLAALPKPCGIMACYDLVGLYVLQACRTIGLHVPEQIAVVGVNNDLTQCELACPPLTSVAQDTFKAGYEAAALLHRLMQGLEPPKVPLKVPPLGLVARSSTDTWLISDSLVTNALRIVREKACLGVTVDDIAHELHITRRTLERRFRIALACTVHDEISRIQMTRAAALLRGTTQTLETIAGKVGFRSASYLTTAFKKEFRCTPGDYRANPTYDFGIKKENPMDSTPPSGGNFSLE